MLLRIWGAMTSELKQIRHKSCIYHANLPQGYVARNTNSSPVLAIIIVLETGDKLRDIVHDKEIFAVADVDDTVETRREFNYK